MVLLNLLEPCLPLDKYGLNYQKEPLLISGPHGISCEEEISKQEILAITQLPYDEVDEDLSLESLFVNTLSYEILSSINLRPL